MTKPQAPVHVVHLHTRHTRIQSTPPPARLLFSLFLPNSRCQTSPTTATGDPTGPSAMRGQNRPAAPRASHSDDEEKPAFATAATPSRRLLQPQHRLSAPHLVGAIARHPGSHSATDTPVTPDPPNGVSRPPQAYARGAARGQAPPTDPSGPRQQATAVGDASQRDHGSEAWAATRARMKRLHRVVELAGGSAVDLAMALVHAGPGADDVATLACALQSAGRCSGAEMAAAAQEAAAAVGEASRRAVALLRVVRLGGGSAVDLVQALLPPAGGDGDVALVIASLQSAKGSNVKGSAAAAGVPPVAAAADAESLSNAASADGGRKRKRERSAASAAAVEEACKVCGRVRHDGDGDRKKTCGACLAMVARLRRKSGGACNRSHVRQAISELGRPDARGVKKLALRLSGCFAASEGPKRKKPRGGSAGVAAEGAWSPGSDAGKQRGSDQAGAGSAPAGDNTGACGVGADGAGSVGAGPCMCGVCGEPVAGEAQGPGKPVCVRCAGLMRQMKMAGVKRRRERLQGAVERCGPGSSREELLAAAVAHKLGGPVDGAAAAMVVRGGAAAGAAVAREAVARAADAGADGATVRALCAGRLGGGRVHRAATCVGGCGMNCGAAAAGRVTCCNACRTCAARVVETWLQVLRSRRCSSSPMRCPARMEGLHRRAARMCRCSRSAPSARAIAGVSGIAGRAMLCGRS